MEKLLSFVVPVYNVEKYISRCLDSIYSQNLIDKQFEVICVNDCTPDNSEKIINEYTKEHNNLKVVRHTVNKGLGAARNTGLKAAEGKYIWYIDSDDYIEKDCIKTLLNEIVENDLDVLNFRFYHQNVDGVFNKNEDSAFDMSVMTGSDYLFRNYKPNLMSSCSRIYRREYLIKNEYFFAEGVYWEDADLVAKMIYYAPRVKAIKDYCYYYCYNSTSIARTTSGKKIADMVKMGARKLSLSKEIQSKSPELAQKIYNDAVWNTTAVKKIIQLTAVEQRVFYHNLKGSAYNDIKNNMHFRQRLLARIPVITSVISLIVRPLMKLKSK